MSGGRPSNNKWLIRMGLLRPPGCLPSYTIVGPEKEKRRGRGERGERGKGRENRGKELLLNIKG